MGAQTTEPTVQHLGESGIFFAFGWPFFWLVLLRPKGNGSKGLPWISARNGPGIFFVVLSFLNSVSQTKRGGRRTKWDTQAKQNNNERRGPSPGKQRAAERNKTAVKGAYPHKAPQRMYKSEKAGRVLERRSWGGPEFRPIGRSPHHAIIQSPPPF